MTNKTRDLDILRTWIGHTQEANDILAPNQARLLQATLDIEPSLEAGDPLPPLWYWTYFLDGKKQSELGRDGHPDLGGFMPPVDLPRRMWAGGRLEIHQPLILGKSYRKVSTIKNVAMKEGRSGSLCFVTVQHQVLTDTGDLCLTEGQDIVYREDAKPGDPAPKQVPPPENADLSRVITPSEVMLFRYSALTFNGHRIHYDRRYCQEVENYPGLIFHGPLSATLLAEIATEATNGATMSGFSFRAMAPLFDTDPFKIKAKKAGDTTCQVWAETPTGGVAMMAEATLA